MARVFFLLIYIYIVYVTGREMLCNRLVWIWQQNLEGSGITTICWQDKPN